MKTFLMMESEKKFQALASFLLRSASTLLNVDADDYDEFESAITCPNELEEFPTLSLRKPEPFTLILNYEEVKSTF